MTSNDINNKDSSLEMQSQTLSEIILGHHIKSTHTQEELNDYEKSAREQYEQLINRKDWKKVLIETAVLLAKEYKNKIKKIIPIQKTFLQFQIGFEQSIKNITSNVLTVGRYYDNDIVLTNISVSRLHLIIFLIYPRILVVDLASLFGTKTLARSSNKEIENVQPKSRKVLEFDWNENVVLRLGTETIITFFPKRCIVCLDGPRSIKLNCGHYILCLNCYQLKDNFQNKCPECRGDIHSQLVEKNFYGIDSFPKNGLVSNQK